MTAPQSVTLAMREAAAAALTCPSLLRQLNYRRRQPLKLSEASVLAALRQLSRPQIAILCRQYGLGMEQRDPVTLAVSLGINSGEITAMVPATVDELKRLLLAQPRAWPSTGRARISPRVLQMLEEVGIGTPQDLTPEAVLRIATDLKGRWGMAASNEVDRVLATHGFELLRGMIPSEKRLPEFVRRGL